jgi:hypothetical protein
MPAEVSVGVDNAGRPIAIKQGFDASTRERIAQEATALAFAQQPGVVELASFEETEGRLCTAWASGGSLEECPDLPSATKTLATAAATLADLHDRGIVHGRVQPGHILLGSNSEAWLTGFAECSLDGSLDRLVDLKAMGVLIEQIVARNASGPRVVPPRPGSGSRPGRSSRDKLINDLRYAARRASNGPGEPQCSMRELARLLREAVDFAPPRPNRRGAPPRRVVIAAAFAAVLGPAVIAIALLNRGHGDEAAAHPLAPAAPFEAQPATTVDTTKISAETTADATGTTVAKMWPPATTIACPHPAGAPSADVDGDGCPEEVTVDHAIVIVGDKHFQLSIDPNDQVLIGDWDCDGAATAAVLRVGTGVVEVFDTWPTPTAPATARQVATDPQAVLLTEKADDRQCALLSITKTDGTSTDVVVDQ